MNSYFVVFGLVRPGENYAKVVREIKRDASWLRFADTVFVITTDEQAVSVRDRIWDEMREGDWVFVGAASAPAAWAGLDPADDDWLQDELAD